MMTLIDYAACIAMDNEYWEELYNRGMYAQAILVTETTLQLLSIDDEDFYV